MNTGSTYTQSEYDRFKVHTVGTFKAWVLNFKILLGFAESFLLIILAALLQHPTKMIFDRDDSLLAGENLDWTLAILSLFVGVVALCTACGCGLLWNSDLRVAHLRQWCSQTQQHETANWPRLWDVLELIETVIGRCLTLVLTLVAGVFCVLVACFFSALAVTGAQLHHHKYRNTVALLTLLSLAVFIDLFLSRVVDNYLTTKMWCQIQRCAIELKTSLHPFTDELDFA